MLIVLIWRMFTAAHPLLVNWLRSDSAGFSLELHQGCKQDGAVGQNIRTRFSASANSKLKKGKKQISLKNIRIKAVCYFPLNLLRKMRALPSQ